MSTETKQLWTAFRPQSSDLWHVGNGTEVSDFKFHSIQQASSLADLLNENDKMRGELSEAVATCERIMDAIAGHTDWHPDPSVDQDNWNEEAHIEPTITVADCRALKRVLESADRLEAYLN